MPSVQCIFQHDYDGDSPNPAALGLAEQAPPWRKFAEKPFSPAPTPRAIRLMDSDQESRGRSYLSDEIEAQLINAALVLRRPLLITGQAGVGKTSLAYAVAWQLGLGNVLRWGVTSRSTLKDALYQYDALARLHDASLREKGVANTTQLDFGDYITLGPLGTALLPTGVTGYCPRVLLIDEIDKSDADLPSDLLHVLEEGAFTISEVGRLPADHKGETVRVNTVEPSLGKIEIPATGRVRCDDFPLIIMTSNGERDFPPAFLRRCLQLTIPRPTRQKLEAIIRTHLKLDIEHENGIQELLDAFDTQRNEQQALLAVDQLLNAVYLARSISSVNPLEHAAIRTAVFRSLSESPQSNS